MKQDEMRGWDGAPPGKFWCCPSCRNVTPMEEWGESVTECETCSEHEARRCPSCHAIFDYLDGAKDIARATEKSTYAGIMNLAREAEKKEELWSARAVDSHRRTEERRKRTAEGASIINTNALGTAKDEIVMLKEILGVTDFQRQLRHAAWLACVEELGAVKKVLAEAVRYRRTRRDKNLQRDPDAFFDALDAFVLDRRCEECAEKQNAECGYCQGAGFRYASL